MERLHRENNFFDHGKDDNALNIRMELYGTILHEGDFEKYQPYCYMNHWNPKFWITKWLSKRINSSNNDAEEIRRVWILMRFVEYQEAEWSKLNDMLTSLKKNIFK